jgi:hypothetical protein
VRSVIRKFVSTTRDADVMGEHQSFHSMLRNDRLLSFCLVTGRGVDGYVREKVI